MEVRRGYKRINRSSREIYYVPVDNNYEADVILTATIEDRWDKIYFSDGTHLYTVLKKPHLKTDGEKPLLSNYDWGFILRIYAIVYWKPFNLDSQRSCDGLKLFYLEAIPEMEGTPSFVEFLDFSGCIYCGENTPYVRISEMSCYTWVSYPDTPLWVFSLAGQIGYFV